MVESYSFPCSCVGTRNNSTSQLLSILLSIYSDFSGFQQPAIFVNDTKNNTNWSIPIYSPQLQETLSPVLDSLLPLLEQHKNNTKIHFISGPGSFTSLRVGNIFLQTLAYSLSCRFLGIDAYSFWAYCFAHLYPELPQFLLVLPATRRKCYVCRVAKSQQGFRFEESHLEIAELSTTACSLPIVSVEKPDLDERIAEQASYLLPFEAQEYFLTIPQNAWQEYKPENNLEIYYSLSPVS